MPKIQAAGLVCHSDVRVVAINSAPWCSLDRWRVFWKEIGAPDVLWAIDDGRSVTRLLEVTHSGTIIIIDRGGRISYRDSGVTSYETLRDAVVEILWPFYLPSDVGV